MISPRISGLIAKFFAIVLGTLAIYLIYFKLTGHSPTVDEITLTMVSFIAVELYATNASLNELKGRFSEHSRKFDSLASDFKAHVSRKNH